MFNPDPMLGHLAAGDRRRGCLRPPPHGRPSGHRAPRRRARAVRERAGARPPTRPSGWCYSLLDDRTARGAASVTAGRLLVRPRRPRPFPCQRLQAAQHATRSRCASCPSACARSRSSARRAACTSCSTSPYGLVLVVGPTGSGKSTTLAAMIDRINETKPVHILTIEDPVEYLHHHKMAMVNQREVGTDVEQLHRRPAQRPS